MGKRRGLGLRRAYNKYVAPVVDAYGTSVYLTPLLKSTKRLTDEIPPEPIDSIPPSWGNQIPGGSGNLRGSHGSNDAHEDEDPPIPGSDSRIQGFGHANRMTHISRNIRLPPQRGIGYKAPGPVFNYGASVVRQQFALELTSGLNHRNFTRMVFRSYARYTHRPLANQPAVLFSKTLSPAPIARVIDGINVNTCVRDGNMSTLPSVTITAATTNPVAAAFGTVVAPVLATVNKEDLFLPLCTLQDLEIASWNANPLKFLNWNSAATDIGGTLVTAPAIGLTNFTPLQVCKDWVLDKTVVETATGSGTGDNATINTECASPFDIIPLESASYGGFTKRFENYLCNLGPGSITFQFQNRLNTSAEIEIVVVQQRMDPKLGTNAIPMYQVGNHLLTTYEYQVNEAYLAKFTSGDVINTGFGGETAVSNDLLLNPTKPFLHEYRKYMTKPGVCRQVSRERFRVLGGASRSCRIQLPELVYDAYEHRRWSQIPAINTPGDPSFSNPIDYIWPHSYSVYIATQGVLMPVFSATKSGDVISNVGSTVVDTQVSPSSVLIHGTYIERPKPCLSVSPTKALQLKDEIKDTVVDVTSGKSPYGVLLSGYVAEPPIATSSSKIVT